PQRGSGSERRRGGDRCPDPAAAVPVLVCAQGNLLPCIRSRWLQRADASWARPVSVLCDDPESGPLRVGSGAPQPALRDCGEHGLAPTIPPPTTRSAVLPGPALQAGEPADGDPSYFCGAPSASGIVTRIVVPA